MGKGAHDGGREPETEAAQPRQDALRAHRREPRPHLPRNHRRAGRGGHRGRAQIGVPRLGRPSRLRSRHREAPHVPGQLRPRLAHLHRRRAHAAHRRRAVLALSHGSHGPSPHRRLGVSGLLPPGRRAFQERARGRPHQDAERIGVPPRGHAARGHPSPSAGGLSLREARREQAPTAPRGRPHLLRDAGVPHLLRGLLLPHRLQREARLLPQLPRRSHAGAAHHR